VDDLFVRVRECAELAGARIITLTGGEPFLQPKAELEELVRRLRNGGYQVEAFTNGTLAYPEWATEKVSMIMDWKLPGSGEDPLNKNRLENIRKLDEASIWHSVKFVCKDEQDFWAAKGLYELQPPSVRGAINWYYGRVWDGEIENARLVELVMMNRLPWLLNVQMHNYIWPANERGR
jgi:7-carboxy-7-deazaguanine synthase